MKKARIIGVMSGTSLDGLDLVAVDFENNKEINWNILASSCIPYDSSWKNKLKDAHFLSAPALLELDAEYGAYIGAQINHFITKFGLHQIDCIASHGHTIFHQPEKGFTLQIGHGAHIQCVTDLPVVCDFRTQDVALGGQGAPLVPIGDRLLFSAYDACVNLGGFANISFELNHERIAFDICPVNYVLNYYTQLLGLPYDDKGAIAKNHPANSDIIKRLNKLNYYEQAPPKSLGREWVEKEVFPVLNTSESIYENIATFTHHVAHQIAKILNTYNLKRVFFTGGGARNTELIRIIQSKTQCEIILGNDELMDYKEALVFALLGYLRLNNTINILASVTGAKRSSIGGIYYS